MANRYEMNIGTINDEAIDTQYVEDSNHGQVYYATHDGEGNSLPIVEKSFISFSWGGKNIEDFSLLVVNDGDSYNGSLYTNFKDLTTEYDINDGQQYWGTTFIANTKSFRLATDGITEKELQQFKAWFKPGIERELILAERPNLAIKARIASTPQFSLLPFKRMEQLIIGESSYEVKTTIWKGSIDLSFVMDDPFWYSTVGIFSTDDLIKSTNKGNIEVKENIKSIFEDGIPCIDMMEDSCLLANNKAVIKTTTIVEEEEINTITGTINTGVELGPSTYQYLYYCGTAKEKPYIKFNMNITTDASSKYFIFPYNSYGENKVNSIFIDKKVDENTYERVATFSFTAPDALLAYNQAVSILTNNFKVGDSIIELRNTLRDALSHPVVRKVALGICERALQNGLNICNKETSELSEGGIELIINKLREMFPLNNADNNYCSFVFDSETGKSYVTMPIKVLTTDTTSITFTDNYIYEENNAGNILRSNYLILDERTLPNNENKITLNECLRLSSNCEINKFIIKYKYRYL